MSTNPAVQAAAEPEVDSMTTREMIIRRTLNTRMRTRRPTETRNLMMTVAAEAAGGAVHGDAGVEAEAEAGRVKSPRRKGRRAACAEAAKRRRAGETKKPRRPRREVYAVAARRRRARGSARSRAKINNTCTVVSYSQKFRDSDILKI